MDKYLYLTINIASVLVPFLASFYPKHAFYKTWKNYFIANFIIAVLFIIWDILFTQIGVWGFNDRYLLGIKIINIPLEEVLFFFCIPYSSVFVYFALNYLVKANPLEKCQKHITLILALGLLITGLIFWERWYTVVTFLLTATFLGYSYVKKKNLSRTYFSYCVTLIFFFIVDETSC